MKKPAALSKRLKRIERELSSVSSNLESLQNKGPEKRPSAPRAAAPRPRSKSKGRSEAERKRGPSRADKQQEPSADPQKAGLRDERFSEYLSTSFQSSRPLKYERKIQRNRAVFMAVIVVLALLWLVSKLWM